MKLCILALLLQCGDMKYRDNYVYDTRREDASHTYFDFLYDLIYRIYFLMVII